LEWVSDTHRRKLACATDGLAYGDPAKRYVIARIGMAQPETD